MYDYDYNQVKVIVMITRLVEGSGSSRKKKADCYWPDKKVMTIISKNTLNEGET